MIIKLLKHMELHWLLTKYISFIDTMSFIEAIDVKDYQLYAYHARIYFYNKYNVKYYGMRKIDQQFRQLFSEQKNTRADVYKLMSSYHLKKLMGPKDFYTYILFANSADRLFNFNLYFKKSLNRAVIADISIGNGEYIDICVIQNPDSNSAEPAKYFLMKGGGGGFREQSRHIDFNSLQYSKIKNNTLFKCVTDLINYEI